MWSKSMVLDETGLCPVASVVPAVTWQVFQLAARLNRSNDIVAHKEQIAIDRK